MAIYVIQWRNLDGFDILLQRLVLFSCLAVRHRRSGIRFLKFDDFTINHLFACMGKVDGDMHIDDRLHLSNAPVGSVGVMNKIAKRKIKHAKLPKGTRTGDAGPLVVKTHMKEGGPRAPMYAFCAHFNS